VRWVHGIGSNSFDLIVLCPLSTKNLANRRNLRHLADILILACSRRNSLVKCRITRTGLSRLSQARRVLRHNTKLTDSIRFRSLKKLTLVVHPTYRVIKQFMTVRRLPTKYTSLINFGGCGRIAAPRSQNGPPAC